MTTKTHYTSVATWTPDAWVTKYRAIVAGGKGRPASSQPASGGGRGVILDAGVSAVSGPVAVGAGAITGGSASGYGGPGGAGSVLGSVIAGAGGGGSWQNNVGWPSGPSWSGGDAAPPGSDAPDPNGYANPGGGKANGNGGYGGSETGTGGGTSGGAGQSHASGGKGGNGASYGGAYAGGGGGGYGGGGGGGAYRYYPLPSDHSQYVTDAGPGGGGSSVGGTFVGYNDDAAYVDIFVAAAPLQPTPLSPTNNAIIDRTSDQLFSFQSNPASDDVLDAQTDAIFEYRLIGAGSWTTIDDLGTATAATIPGGTLAIGSYEGRYRTKADGGVGDEFGIWGPNSETFYFRADDPAVAPVITSPQPNDVVAVNSATAVWTVASQTSYQMRVLGDNAGAPDTGTIYADSGEQVSADRTKTLTIGANHVPAHVQVRVRDKTSGVWSAWASVAVTIEWAGPPKPRVTLATDWRIHVTVTNPDPVGVEPTADRIEIYVHETNDRGERIRERRAILAPGDGWIYETPPSGVDVGVEAVVIYTPTNVMTSSGVIY